MDSSRYAQLFLDEGRELVARMNEALLALERDPEPAPHVHALFRAVHTFKGMAGAMSYEAVAAAAHALEERLALLRDAAARPEAAAVDALFAGVDWLDAAVTHVAAVGDADALDADELLQRLGALPAPAAAGDRRGTLRATDRPVPEGARRLVVRQRAGAVLPGARAVMALQRLRALGTLLHVDPPEPVLAVATGACTFEVDLVSEAAETALVEAVRAAGEVDEVVVVARERRARLAAPAEPAAAPAPAGEPTPAVTTALVRVEQRRLDRLMALTSELVLARGQVRARAAALGDPGLVDASARLERLVGALQDEVLATRLVAAAVVFDRFPRFVRDAARALGKDVQFVMVGREIELDRSLLDEMGEPLVHLLRNAIDHGLEPRTEREAAGKPPVGTLQLSVTRERDGVVVRVRDDGRGVDRRKVLARAKAAGLVPAGQQLLGDDDLLRILATAGLSTAEQVTALSGRGVGVDAVLATVRRLGGTMDLRTQEGEGSVWSLRLPATLAIVRAVLARVGDETYALPATHVRASADVAAAELATVRGREVVLLGEEVLPLVRLRQVVGLPPAVGAAEADLIVVAAEDRRVGLLVDELIAQEEIVVKPFDAAREGARLFSGATVLADGIPALIVDVGSLF